MQRKFLVNLILLIVLNLLVKPIAIFGIDATVQNQVGAEEYGLYFSLLNFSFLFNILLDLGINNYTTKHVAQYPDIVPKYMGKVLGIRFLLFVLYVSFSLGIGFIVGYDERAFSLLYWLLFNQFLATMIAYFRSHFTGLLLFRTDAIISVLDRLLLILFCGAVLFGPVQTPMTIELFVYIQTVCYGIALLIAVIVLFAKIGTPRLNWKSTFSLVILRKSFPYALLILLMMVYTRTDSVMLERLHSEGKYEAGIYAQGFRLLDAFFMFAMLFSNMLFPIFSKMIKEKDRELKSLVRMSASLLILGATALAILILINGSTILSWIYTQNIEASTVPFQLLMFTFIGMTTTLIYGTLLTASGNLKFLNTLSAIGILVNVVLNILLIPNQGAKGAAIATLTTQLLIGLIQFVYVHRHFKWSFERTKLAMNLGFVLLLLGLWALTSNYPIHLAFQLLIIGVLLIVFKVVDIRYFRSVLRNE